MPRPGWVAGLPCCRRADGWEGPGWVEKKSKECDCGSADILVALLLEHNFADL